MATILNKNMPKSNKISKNKSGKHHKASDTISAQIMTFDTNVNNMKNNREKDIPNYYQIATPKSPHDLTTLSGDDNDDINNNISQSSSTANDKNLHHSSVPILPSRESEDMERFKYVTAKRELLNQINLHILLGHKEINVINREINNVDAQMTLLKYIHNDKHLMTKISEYRAKKLNQSKCELEILKNPNRINSHSIAFADNLPISSASTNMSHHYHTRSKSQGNLLDIDSLQPIDSSILNARVVRSNKTPNNNILGKGMSDISNKTNQTGFEIQNFKPNQMNTHHRRVYSSSCLSNNSGIIGRTDDNKPIFRRYDGILVVITCVFCGRSDFTSAQGIVNHSRLKHHKTYSSQPLTVLHNQELLPGDKQDKDTLEKFKSLGLDPHKDYLPYNIAIPTMSTVPKNHKSSITQLSEHLSTDTPMHTITSNGPKEHKTDHLKQIYKKADFNELIQMVDDAQNDLNVVLEVPTDNDEDDNEIDEENNENDEINETEENALDTDYKENDKDQDEDEEDDKDDVGDICKELEDSTDDSNVVITPLSSSSSSDNDESEEDEEITPPLATRIRGSSISSKETHLINNKKRSLRNMRSLDEPKGKEDIVEDLTIAERLRPAEKTVRNDIFAVNKLPEHERRSRHYNLRAKSKLRGSNNYLD